MFIRESEPIDHPKIIAMAENLPQWFTPAGVSQLRHDLDVHEGLIATDGSELLGFILYDLKKDIEKAHSADKLAQISWMGVRSGHHRKGAGSLLLAKLRKILSEKEVQILQVSTLGDSVNYEPYERTRAFYRKNGFVDYKTISHPDNPEQEEELLLRAKI